MTPSFRVLLFATAGIALAGRAETVIAAEAPAAAAPGGAEVTEVVVTAQKRSESVQTIAAGITAISGAALDQRGITNVNDLQFAAPSFHSGTLTGSTGITIRGVGATTVGTGGSPGVGVNIDGVYQTGTGTVDIGEIDLERVEVLRGPQGTLYGRNATGGAVNFLTNAPTGQFGGSLLAGYAEYDEYHLQGILNVPLGDRVRTRLVVDWRDREDGFVKNIEPGGQDVDKGKTLLTRFRLQADVTKDLTFDLGLSAMHSTGPWQYLTNHGPPNPFLSNATFVSQPWRTDVNDPVTGARDYQSISGTFTWRLPFGVLKSITAYQNYLYTDQNDGDGTNVSAAPYQGRTRDQAVTQEFDLIGHTGPLDWVTGFFFLSESNFNSLNYNLSLGLSGLPPGSYLNFTQPRYDTQSYAGFADATYHLTDKLKLIVGARYSEDDQTAVYNNTFGLVEGGAHVFLASFCPLYAPEGSYETDQLKSDSFTPRAGLQYAFTPKVNAYFTYSKGFKAGGANIYSCGDDFKPEKITAYEGGFKTRLFDNAVTFNVSGFYYDYTNFQVSQIIGLSLNVTNAAAAEIKGVELEAAWAADRHWTVSLNGSYIDATYSNFSNLDGLNPQLGVQNLDGKLLDNSPRESANLGLTYRSDPFNFGRLTARFDASFRSRTYFREFNNPLDSQAPYGLVNLNLIWDSPDERYSARLYATNLTGQAYLQAEGDSTSIGTRYVTWGSPRQIGGEIKVKF
jgi:iron complex outermembrane receptor protein